MMEISLKKLLTSPISGENPAGVSVRYENVFDLVQQEIDKMSSLFSSGETDWQKVMELSKKILLEQSKDALVASYLCFSLIRLKKSKDFIEALGGYKKMLERFWDNLFPPRIKARIAAINWLVEKVSSDFEQHGPLEYLSKKQAKKAKSTFEAIEKIFGDYSGEGDVDFSLVLRPLRDISKKEEKSPENDIDVLPESKGQDVPEARSETPGNYESSEKFSLQSLRRLAKSCIDACPYDRKSYKLVRVSIWEMVDELPLNNGGKTQVPNPKNFINFAKLIEDKDWHELLSGAEGKAYDPAYTFSLDIHRYVATALFNLGPEYKQAYETVCFETLGFVNRLPGVENLSFFDGTSFADEKTKEWINTELKSPSFSEHQQIGKSAVRPLKTNFDKTVSEILSKAMRMANNRKQIPAMVRMMQRRINMVVSSRPKMILRLGLNKILSGKSEFETIVIANNEAILSDVRKFRLEEWDHEIALEALISAYRAYKLVKDKKHRAMAEEILYRIGRFDLVSVANI